MYNEEILYHYGIKRRSGRYPYGSGDRPFQRTGFGQTIRNFIGNIAQNDRSDRNGSQQRYDAIKSMISEDNLSASFIFNLLESNPNNLGEFGSVYIKTLMDGSTHSIQDLLAMDPNFDMSEIDQLIDQYQDPSSLDAYLTSYELASNILDASLGNLSDEKTYDTMISILQDINRTFNTPKKYKEKKNSESLPNNDSKETKTNQIKKKEELSSKKTSSKKR